MKFSKRKLLLSFLAIPLLISCSNVPKFSKGYEYNYAPQADEIAYRTETDRFDYGQDIPIFIAFGHGPGYSLGLPGTPISFELTFKYLDLTNKVERYHLLDEIAPNDYLSDDFTFYLNSNTKTTDYSFEKQYNISSDFIELFKNKKASSCYIMLFVEIMVEGNIKTFELASTTLDFLFRDTYIEFYYY